MSHMYALGNTVGTPKGNAEVINISGGWTTVKLAGGDEFKLRNSAITAPANGAAASMDEVKARVPAHRKVVDASGEPKAARAAKPVREPKPPKAAKPPKPPKSPKPPKAPRVKKQVDPDSPFANLNRMRTRCIDQHEPGTAVEFSCGDEVAQKLAGMPLDEVYALAKKIIGQDFSKQYVHLNVGMQRMNLGNRIRAAYRRAKEEAAAK